MGWEGVHLFLFDICAVRYGSFELHAANSDVPLLKFDFSVNERFSCIRAFAIGTCLLMTGRLRGHAEVEATAGCARMT